MTLRTVLLAVVIGSLKGNAEHCGQTILGN